MKIFAIATLVSLGALVLACSADETGTSSSTAGQGGAGAVGGSASSSGAGGEGAGGAASSSSQGGSATSTGGAGVGGAMVATPECVKDADCKLIDTCCDCAGVPSGSDLPCNDTTCKESSCSLYPTQPVEAQCRAGQCVTTIDCDISKVMCKQLPPDCPEGQTHTVDPTTECWGPCAPQIECAQVAGCEQCVHSSCVLYATQMGPEAHCVDLSAECGETEDCQCMGPAVCIMPYDSCTPSAAGIQCHCLTC